VSAHFAVWDEDTLDLAVLDVTVGLASAERERLSKLVDARDLEHFERTVAALSLAGLGALEPLPEGLRNRIEADAPRHMGIEHAPAVAPVATRAVTRPKISLLSISGWLVAAALLAVSLLEHSDDRADDPGKRRDLLSTNAPDLVRAEWKSTSDPLAANISGDVLWSSRRQEGYMRFRSLAPNDRTQHEYQLWIFDPTRKEWDAKPVDGGVFDAAENGEIVVPIHAKLEVRQAKMFAVTLEDPGGAVVSKREHLLATASP
jgi:hypothetical protein